MIDFNEYNKKNIILELNNQKIDIYYNNNNNKEKLIINTPIMRTPFGLEQSYNNLLIKGEFKNIKENLIMENFYNFIITLHKDLIELVYVKFNKCIEINPDIRYSKFDPLLTIKIIQYKNQIKTDFFFNDDLITYKDILKNDNFIAKLLIDNIFFFKNKYSCKFKAISIKKCNN